MIIPASDIILTIALDTNITLFTPVFGVSSSLFELDVEVLGLS